MDFAYPKSILGLHEPRHGLLAQTSPIIHIFLNCCPKDVFEVLTRKIQFIQIDHQQKKKKMVG